MTRAYYNEIDPYAAQWLRNLASTGLIPAGDVDERSIADVQPDDVRGYTQAHFFAGLGGWAYACRLAGWPNDRAIWTGSCPCQPFSVAGKGAGADDPRHLWPDFFRLIRAARPAVVMGEQVAGTAGYGWLDGVRADLAGEGYASRGVDIPACAVDAPHIRSRLYWLAVADAGCPERRTFPEGRDELDWPNGRRKEASSRSELDRAALGDTLLAGLSPSEREAVLGTGRGNEGRATGEPSRALGDAGCDGSDQGRGLCGEDGEAPVRERRRLRPEPRHDGALGDTERAAAQLRREPGELPREASEAESQVEQRERSGDAPRHSSGRNGSFWSDAEWITGADEKSRRAQSGVRLLVDGVPARVAKLRALGNAIVPQVAAEVIRSFMECAPCHVHN